MGTPSTAGLVLVLLVESWAPFGLSRVNETPGSRAGLLPASPWAGSCPLIGWPLPGRRELLSWGKTSAPQAGCERGALASCLFPLLMGLRCLWGWKLLGCLCALFLFTLFWCLLLLRLLSKDAQKMWQVSARLHAAHSRGSAASAHEGVDVWSLFSEKKPEPHCEPGQVLLILVASAPGNAETRQVIRRTWAAQMKPPDPPWQTVFLVGQSLDEGAAQQVQQEQWAFGDILLGIYLDTYRNLTLKVLHGLQWAVERCRPSYLLKTDDDCFVNTDRLPAFLARRSPLERGGLLYAGSLFPREKRRVVRHPASKWYVSREDYLPDEYPPYASGIGYVLSLGAARRVLQVAERVRPIPVEDAYVGILAQQAGLRLTSSARFAKQNARWHLCNYRYLMVIHHLSAREQEAATRRMREAHAACRGNPEVTGWK